MPSLTVTGKTHVAITIEWGVATGAKSYHTSKELFVPPVGPRAQTASLEAVTQQATSTRTHRFTGLVPQTCYYLRVWTTGDGSTRRAVAGPRAQVRECTDGPEVSVSVSVSGSEITEGDTARSILMASHALRFPISVTVAAIEDGSFLTGSKTRTVSMAAFSTTGSVTFSTRDDSVDEPDGSI